jgi:hypothetical protein
MTTISRGPAGLPAGSFSKGAPRGPLPASGSDPRPELAVQVAAENVAAKRTAADLLGEPAAAKARGRAGAEFDREL